MQNGIPSLLSDTSLNRMHQESLLSDTSLNQMHQELVACSSACLVLGLE
jgi:hypothetical protein